MKVLVCGSRDFNDFQQLSETLSTLDITEVIQGGARGADRLSKDWAVQNNVHSKEFRADWNVYGRRAGPIRNAKMLREGKPDLVVAFWDGQSPGTRHMISIAREAGVKVIVVEVSS